MQFYFTLDCQKWNTMKCQKSDNTPHLKTKEKKNRKTPKYVKCNKAIHA